MATPHPVDRLAGLSRQFGPGRSQEKLRLLEEIAALKRHSSRRLVLLHDTLCYMRAYPDSARVLSAVCALCDELRDLVERRTGGDEMFPALINTGLPGTTNAYGYSYGVAQRLAALFPGCLDLDWAEITEMPPIVDAINLTVAPGESRGLEDEFQDVSDWLAENATRSGQTGLEVVLDLFARSGLPARHQMHVFETTALPLLFRLTERGSARAEAALMPARPCFQRGPVPTSRFPLKPRIVRPLASSRSLRASEGRRMLDLALVALSGRNLEIHPLIYANADDVTLVDGARGLQVLLAGMVPEFRQTLESDFFFLILKNGMPIAYGPASVFAGCCEMGINLFREYRGGEIRHVYAQLMNALYHHAGVRYFFLTSYGMGDGNPEALKSGAFWFYRKLGFRAADPDIEALAREQEAIMRRRPGYRCPMSVLRALSYTDAYLDLSGGQCAPLNFEWLGHVVSEHITKEFAGDRARAGRAAVRLVLQALNIDDYAEWMGAERVALERFAGVLALIRDLATWSQRDKRSLVAAIRARGGPRESLYTRRVASAARLVEALHAIANDWGRRAGRTR